MNRIYERLSHVRFLANSYGFKLLFIAILGIILPLTGLVIFMLYSRYSEGSVTVILPTLLFSLFATGVTLYILNGMLAPLRKSHMAMQSYRQQRILPDLPLNFKDDPGVLMQNIKLTITELNDMMQEKKDLTELLSHDLRLPLRNVKTLSKLLLDVPDHLTVPEISKMIQESAEEQSNLLEEVLDILKQDTLFFNADANEKVKIKDIIQETVQSFTILAAEKNIKLDTDLKYDGSIKVQPELFKQAMKNLISNAIKFSYPDSRVKIDVYKKELNTIIDITDQGMGFEPNVTEHMFDRFTHDGRKGTAGEPSAGIGLYLSRKIIKHHNGDLYATSPGTGKGSTFTITLAA